MLGSLLGLFAFSHGKVFYLKKFQQKAGELGIRHLAIVFSSPCHFLPPFKSLEAESEGKEMKNSG